MELVRYVFEQGCTESIGRIQPCVLPNYIGKVYNNGGLSCSHSAPTTEATQQEVDSFYTLLQSIVNEQKDGAFLILMGDFSTKLGTDWDKCWWCNSEI